MQEILAIKLKSALGDNFESALNKFKEMMVKENSRFDKFDRVLSAISARRDSCIDVAAQLVEKAKAGIGPLSKEEVEKKVRRLTHASEKFLQTAVDVVEMELGLIPEYEDCMKIHKVVCELLLFRMDNVALYESYCDIFKVEKANEIMTDILKAKALKIRASVKMRDKDLECLAKIKKINAWLSTHSGAAGSDEVPEGVGGKVAEVDEIPEGFGSNSDFSESEGEDDWGFGDLDINEDQFIEVRESKVSM